jgi:glyoxylase-like metal-dependent hydrolase (beta-lactamase superfamily II)
MKPTRVALLDGGVMYAKEYQVYWNRASEKLIGMPAYGVLIEHADGYFLFDTGFDLHHFQTAISPTGAVQSEQQTIPAQLSLLGLDAGDIDFVVNSHYHFDHCGGNKHCRHAKTLCHKCELEAAYKPEPFEALTYSDRSFEPVRGMGADIDIYTPRFETLCGDQEIAKGLHLIETPGHTLGHSSLLVELGGRRPMLFPADACYTQKSFDELIVPSSHVDPVRGYQSILKIRDLARKHDAEVFFPHDEVNYASYLKAPYWYS